MGLYAHEGWEGRWHRASGRLGGWQDADGQKQGHAPRRRRLRRYSRLYAPVNERRAAPGTRAAIRVSARPRPIRTQARPRPVGTALDDSPEGEHPLIGGEGGIRTHEPLAQ